MDTYLFLFLSRLYLNAQPTSILYNHCFLGNGALAVHKSHQCRWLFRLRVPPQRQQCLHVDLARWTLKILYGSLYYVYLVHSYFRLSRNRKERRYASYIHPRNYIYIDRNGFYNFPAYKMLYTWNEFLPIYVSNIQVIYESFYSFYICAIQSVRLDSVDSQ